MRFVVFLAMALAMSYVRPERVPASCVFAAYVGVILLLILVEVIGAVGGGARAGSISASSGSSRRS